MPTASIIIPNYNGAEHLPLCLQSIAQQTYRDYEIIVVDNGSVDHSIEILSAHASAVRVFSFGSNKGFAAAVNYGIQKAEGDYIVLLNNDVELDARWLEVMIFGLQAHPEAGSAACKMMNFYNRAVIDAAGDVLTKSGNVISRGAGIPDTGQYNEKTFVFGACAGAGIYRRNIFTDVGLFDEDYFAWFEDADHHFRSQLKGFRSVYLPSAVCYHKRGATAKKMSSLATRLHARNQLYCMIINLPGDILRSYWPYIIASRFKNWVTIMFHGGGISLGWAFTNVIRELPQLLRKRKLVQQSRVVSEDYLRSQLN